MQTCSFYFDKKAVLHKQNSFFLVCNIPFHEDSESKQQEDDKVSPA
ncbi:hypothetical protein BSUW23_04590 [Bacillus spizizenii str. W23]|uniref:Uncharacterized protein n=1 Tax=Bacillus spizizenii (strain ATCC 23059 / NRRL B-14472 / W23) TaxID=655816 RepID=E0TWY8_BACSH|nr:hypothetical protein BSUW23_04590 [Bacillus spizizenii str. W23]